MARKRCSMNCIAQAGKIDFFTSRTESLHALTNAAIASRILLTQNRHQPLGCLCAGGANVQTDHHSGRGDTGYPVLEDRLLWKVEGDAGGIVGLQKAGRLSGMGDRVSGFVRAPLFDRSADLSHVEMNIGYPRLIQSR